MPMIRVQLSAPVSDPKRPPLMKRLSATVASLLGKPESYMMVVLETETSMLMSGKTDLAALVELRSVGTISAKQATDLSREITALLGEETGVAGNRVYLNFTGVPGAMWGHDGATFG
jgi:phenylpyruvate tautomerase PptA (4-oxalocrotonate tautomerase family)